MSDPRFLSKRPIAPKRAAKQPSISSARSTTFLPPRPVTFVPANARQVTSTGNNGTVTKVMVPGGTTAPVLK